MSGVIVIIIENKLNELCSVIFVYVSVGEEREREQESD